MDAAILSASAGLIGSLIGGVSTFAASWVTEHKLLGTQTRMRHVAKRQELRSDFIIEATSCLVEAWSHQAEGPEVISKLYSAVERMRLVSSSRVVQCAEEVMRGVIAAYAEPNRTFDELKQLVQERSEEYDRLWEFTEACKLMTRHVSCQGSIGYVNASMRACVHDCGELELGRVVGSHPTDTFDGPITGNVDRCRTSPFGEYLVREEPARRGEGSSALGNERRMHLCQRYRSRGCRTGPQQS
jgi:hypothetical protein